MEGSVVTAKGQVVIPSRIRKQYKIKKGTPVYFFEQEDGILLKPLTDDSIEKAKGILKTKGKVLKTLLREKKTEREL